MSYLQVLECTACGGEFDADTVHGVCPRCQKVLFARYDLAALRNAMTPDDFLRRGWDMWRYRELLPVRNAANVVTLGEGMTPLLRVGELVSARLGFKGGRLTIKDEGKNPTGSFKARGMAAAISKAKELGITEVALASAGNAGSAAAAYAAAAGIRAHIAVPRDVPPVNLVEMRLGGGDVILVDGLIDEAGRVVQQQATERGWFELNTLKEPYRQEGKKTLGFELAEQGADHAKPWEGAATIAAGIRVPSAIGDYLVLQAVRDSGGAAVAVSDDEIRAGQLEMAREVGIYGGPESGATWAALKALRQRGFLSGEEDVVLFSTAIGTKSEPP
jgi:threonine synthase